MSLLGNLNSSVPKNPMQFINMMTGNNPQFRQTINMIQQLTNGDINKAKDVAIQKFRNSNMSKEQFSEFSRFAKEMGTPNEILGELEQYVK